MPGHFIIKCSNCGIIISQCRCPSKDKEIKYELCPGCQVIKYQIDTCDKK